MLMRPRSDPALLVQDVVVNVEAVVDLALSVARSIVYVSHTCADHSDMRVMSTETGSCAAVAVGRGLIEFCRMLVLFVRFTSQLARMLVSVHLLYMYALTLRA